MMMNLADRGVAVVGGGKVAARKIAALLASGAAVTVIAPRVEDEVSGLASAGRIVWINARFSENLLDEIPDLTLVFGATDDREIGKALYEAAMQRGVPCNIADDPELCTFILPAVLARGDLMICVSSGGASPALSRRLREELEEQFGDEYAILTRLLADLRGRVLDLGRSSDENRALFYQVVDSDLLSALRERDWERSSEILGKILPESVAPQPLIRRAVSGPQGEEPSAWI
jgi:precorrin-2 dehydrogenase / sirohydrochlorin ferrochelatase